MKKETFKVYRAFCGSKHTAPYDKHSFIVLKNHEDYPDDLNNYLLETSRDFKTKQGAKKWIHEKEQQDMRFYFIFDTIVSLQDDWFNDIKEGECTLTEWIGKDGTECTSKVFNWFSDIQSKKRMYETQTKEYLAKSKHVTEYQKGLRKIADQRYQDAVKGGLFDCDDITFESEEALSQKGEL